MIDGDKNKTQSELLEQDYFSNSRQENIKYGDMDLFHFIRVFINKE